MKKFFSFSGLNLANETIDFINFSSSINHENPYSVFKKKKTDANWRMLPTPVINYVQEDLKGTELEVFLNE